MKRRTACLVLFYMLSALAGAGVATLIGLEQPVVAIVANLCGIATLVWMTTSEKGKKMTL